MINKYYTFIVIQIKVDFDLRRKSYKNCKVLVISTIKLIDYTYLKKFISEFFFHLLLQFLTQQDTGIVNIIRLRVC